MDLKLKHGLQEVIDFKSLGYIINNLDWRENSKEIPRKENWKKKRKNSHK